MKLSKLQRYILSQLYWTKNRKAKRQQFYSFYDNFKRKPKLKIIQDTITKSVENLIAKGLVTALGVKTAKKLYIQEVRLTPEGRKWIKYSLDKQKRLPFKNLKRKNQSFPLVAGPRQTAVAKPKLKS